MSFAELQIVNNSLKVRAVTYTGYSKLLITKEIEIPVVPGSIVKPNEILGKIHYTSINLLDFILKGLSRGCINAQNKVIDCDFSGEVIKTGSNTKYKAGDEIFGDILNMLKRGTSSEYIMFEPAKAITCELIPEGMSFEQAGSLAIVSATNSLPMFECLQG